MNRMMVITGVLATFLLSSLTILAQTKPREDLLREIETKPAELEALERDFLSPSEADRNLYADFLRQPNTGIVRLLPTTAFSQISATCRSKASVSTPGSESAGGIHSGQKGTRG